MTLQEIFNIITGDSEPVSLQLDSATYNSLRASLIRKFKQQRELCESVGLEHFTGMYVACEYDNDTMTATFALKHKSAAKRVPKQYGVLKL